ncbi:MAG: hypothetical protein JW940_22980 [Polyangiaceae bacterium]|nr:hypothetical protein [Polyangiaceae bacterium]
MALSPPRLRDLAALTLALVLVALPAPVPASPSTNDGASARELFEQARQLMHQGKYSEACPKLEESRRLEAKSATLINLGDCYEKEGKLASAWAAYIEAASAAARDGKDARARAARARAEALASLVPKIVITVASANKVAGLEVFCDSKAVGADEWGQALPFDPGEHKLSASAPDREPWETTVSLEKGQTVTVEVPELEPHSVPVAPPVPPPPPERQPTLVAPSAAPAVTHDRQTHAFELPPPLVLVFAGVGVAGLAVGTISGLVSMSKHDEAAKHCDGSACRDTEGVELKDDARLAGNISTVSFIVGAAGLAAGTTFWLMANHESAAPTQARVSIGPRSIAVQGSW